MRTCEDGCNGCDECTDYGDYADEDDEPAERLLIAAMGESLGMVAGGRNSSRRRLVIG